MSFHKVQDAGRMRFLSSVVASVSLFGAVACNRGPAGTAVAARTESGSLLRWTTPKVVLHLSPEVVGAATPRPVVDALSAAIDVWNSSLSACGAPRFVRSTIPLKRAAIRFDSINEILFRTRKWCPPDAIDFDDCYDRSLHASTRLRPELRPGQPSDGELREADMEVNGVSFRWSAIGREPGTLSLRTMFVHELGHMLGLDHPCAPRGSRSRASGRTELDCTDSTVQKAVMHPDAAELLRGEQVSPLPAEVAQICAIYGSTAR
jgi:hypothetical protein